jgi:hypothetical protein
LDADFVRLWERFLSFVDFVLRLDFLLPSGLGSEDSWTGSGAGACCFLDFFVFGGFTSAVGADLPGVLID